MLEDVGISAFRQPQRHPPAWVPSTSHLTIPHNSLNWLSRTPWPVVLGQTGLSVLHAVGCYGSRRIGHSYFCSILSPVRPEITAKSFLGWEPRILIVSSPQDSLYIKESWPWLKIKKLFQFLQMSKADYQRHPVPVTCPTSTCLPNPMCREITRRACRNLQESICYFLSSGSLTNKGKIKLNGTNIKCIYMLGTLIQASLFKLIICKHGQLSL